MAFVGVMRSRTCLFAAGPRGVAAALVGDAYPNKVIIPPAGSRFTPTAASGERTSSSSSTTTSPSSPRTGPCETYAAPFPEIVRASWHSARPWPCVAPLRGGPASWRFSRGRGLHDAHDAPPGSVERGLEDMSHFELFGMDASTFDVDLAELERRFKALQKELHPDKLGPDASDAARAQSESDSARVNEAYGVLRRPLPRAQYLLRLRGGPSAALEEASKMSDVMFLQEVMALREKLEETADNSSGELDALEADVRDEMDKLVAAIGRGFEEDLEDENGGSLCVVREATAKLKYFDNIMASILEKK